MKTTIIAAFSTAVALSFGLSAAQAQSPIDPTHYQCYRAIESTKPLPAKPVKLADQFQAFDTRTARVAFLCVPVEKNGEPIKDKETHLVCFTIRGKDPKKKVLVRHQFGEQQLTIGTSTHLCLPATKRVL